jgi:hypothetical protein
VRRKTAQIPDWYIRKLLKNAKAFRGLLENNDFTPDLIQSKREELQARRLLRRYKIYEKEVKK